MPIECWMERSDDIAVRTNKAEIWTLIEAYCRVVDWGREELGEATGIAVSSINAWAKHKHPAVPKRSALYAVATRLFAEFERTGRYPKGWSASVKWDLLDHILHKLLDSSGYAYGRGGQLDRAWERMKASGEVRIGWSPSSSGIAASARPLGYTACCFIAAAFGVKCELVYLPEHELHTALDSGDIDIIAPSVSVTASALHGDVRFSEPVADIMFRGNGVLAPAKAPKEQLLSSVVPIAIAGNDVSMFLVRTLFTGIPHRVALSVKEAVNLLGDAGAKAFHGATALIVADELTCAAIRAIAPSELSLLARPDQWVDQTWTRQDSWEAQYAAWGLGIRFSLAFRTSTREPQLGSAINGALSYLNQSVVAGVVQDEVRSMFLTRSRADELARKTNEVMPAKQLTAAQIAAVLANYRNPENRKG